MLEPSVEEEAWSPKLAETVAATMTRDIMRRGWKVGELLGSEAELSKRYKVSRWVMREAISIAEHDGLVEIRRGRNGGIAIAAPALETIGSSIRSFLEVGRVSGRHLTEARALLESLAMSLASSRLDDALIERLRAASAKGEKVTNENSLELAYELLREILYAADNEILRVFTYALAQVTADLALRRGVSEAALRKAGVALTKFRRQQIEAIVAADRERMNQLVREHLEVAAGLVKAAPRATANPRLIDLTRALITNRATDAPRRLKRTEEITQTLQAEVIANNWPADHLLGSEGDLMARFGVSRSVLREGVRPLERLGIVSMRRGPSSGLRVTRPDPQAIIRSVTLYLNHAQVPQRSIHDILRVLELAAIGGAMTLDPAQREARIAAIEATLARAQKPTVERLERMMGAFYFALASLTPNPVVSLFMRILSESGTFHWPERVTPDILQKTLDGLRSRITALLDAIRAGDENLARRRMMELRKLDVAFGLKLRAPDSLRGDAGD
ncbi:MAG TPA: GntR family transcriptional regulator [Nevskiaceae bacterium]|nr:GntR family transcriptional regulator [Nevskiaceae bacterium]